MGLSMLKSVVSEPCCQTSQQVNISIGAWRYTQIGFFVPPKEGKKEEKKKRKTTKMMKNGRVT